MWKSCSSVTVTGLKMLYEVPISFSVLMFGPDLDTTEANQMNCVSFGLGNLIGKPRNDIFISGYIDLSVFPMF